jgi:hypothetical protein
MSPRCGNAFWLAWCRCAGFLITLNLRKSLPLARKPIGQTLMPFYKIFRADEPISHIQAAPASYPPTPAPVPVCGLYLKSPARAAGKPFQLRIPLGLDVTQPETHHPANFVMRQMTHLAPVINCPTRDLEMFGKLAFRQKRVIRRHLNGCWWLRLHGIMCGRLNFHADDLSDGCSQAGN